MQPIQWTERPTGALVAINSLWPIIGNVQLSVLPESKGFKLEEYQPKENMSKKQPKCNHVVGSDTIQTFYIFQMYTCSCGQ
jgi:hypothetical protein